MIYGGFNTIYSDLFCAGVRWTVGRVVDSATLCGDYCLYWRYALMVSGQGMVLNRNGLRNQSG